MKLDLLRQMAGLRRRVGVEIITYQPDLFRLRKVLFGQVVHATRKFLAGTSPP